MLGEAAYCLVNIDAVCEFVRNVDASNLGADRVMAPEDPSITGRLRRSTGASSTPGREKLAVEVEDAFVAASRVVTGVFGGTQKMLTRAMDQPAPFMGNDASTGKPRTLEDVKNVLSGQAKDAGASFARARVELLKRATSVQSGSLTTMGRDRSKSEVPSSNARELQEVKHTGSPEQPGREGEGRSLRSFFNREERSASDSGDRPSFSDRLSGLPGLSRLNDRSAKAAKDPPKVNPPQAGRVLIADPSERTEQSPLLTAIAGNRSRRIPPQLPVGEDPEATPTATSAPRLGDGPPSLPPRTSSSKQRKLDPPISTLLECDAEDLRLKDIAGKLDCLSGRLQTDVLSPQYCWQTIEDLHRHVTVRDSSPRNDFWCSQPVVLARAAFCSVLAPQCSQFYSDASPSVDLEVHSGDEPGFVARQKQGRVRCTHGRISTAHRTGIANRPMSRGSLSLPRGTESTNIFFLASVS